MKYLASLAILCSLVLPVHATLRCVATNGNNANSCATAVHATDCALLADSSKKATLGGTTGAGQCAVAGDTIYLEAGTYTAGFFESAQTLADGSAGNPITVRNQGTDVVWLVPTTGQQVVNLTTKAYWVFDGINVNGRQLNSGSATGTKGYSLGASTDHITLKNLIVRDTANNSGLGTGGIGIFPQGNNHLIQNVEVDGTHIIGGATSGGDYLGSHCIYAGDDAENTIIERSHLHNCGGLGMQFNDATTGSPTRSNNIIRQTLIHNFGRNPNQTRVGISLTTKQINACAYNNIIYSGPGAGITVYGLGNADNCVYNNTIIGQTSYCIDVGVFTAALRPLIKNNLCYGNGQPIRIRPAATDAVVANNVVAKQGTPYPVAVIDAGTNTTITETIINDPLLLNIGANPPDVHLGPTSSAINTGVDLYAATPAVTTDYAGTARTAHAGGDTLFEIGAYTVVAEVLPIHLEFLSGPASGTLVDAAFSVSVIIKDSAGTVQTSINTGDVTFSLSSGTGTLNGTTSCTPVAGACTRSGLSINAADTDFKIRADRTDTEFAETATFSIVTAAPTPLVIQVRP